MILRVSIRLRVTRVGIGGQNFSHSEKLCWIKGPAQNLGMGKGLEMSSFESKIILNLH